MLNILNAKKRAATTFVYRHPLITLDKSIKPEKAYRSKHRRYVSLTMYLPGISNNSGKTKLMMEKASETPFFLLNTITSNANSAVMKPGNEHPNK